MEKQDWFEELLALSGIIITPKQAAIHKAAIELFAEKGYAATSTKDIAQRAAVAEGTIFKLYKSKYELMLGVTRILTQSGVRPLFGKAKPEELLLVESFQGFLSNIYRNIIKQLQDMLPVMQFLLQEIPFHPEAKAILAQKLPTEELKNLFACFQARGEIRKDLTAEQVLEVFLCSTLGFVAMHYIIKPGFFKEKTFTTASDMEYYINFVYQGLACAGNTKKQERGETDVQKA